MNVKITLYSILIATVAFCGISLVFYFGDWSRLIFCALTGLFVGILLAPELEPKKFRNGWLLQISAGAIAGIFIGLFFRQESEFIIYCSILGGFIGWTAPKWIKHFPFP
jgi:presenilin-like A22 family membrane protease